MTKPPVHFKAEAFSLVEIMVVIAVISVTAGLGGGLYVGSYQRMQVEKAARQLYSAARYGQLVAVERQQSVQLCLDPRRSRFFLMTRQQNGTGQARQGVINDHLCKPVELSEPIRLEAIDIQSSVYGQEPQESASEDQMVTFRPDGTASGALIQIGDAKRHYTVSVCPITAKVSLAVGTAEKVPTTTLDLDATL